MKRKSDRYKLNKSDQVKIMIRSSFSAKSWAKLCPLIISKKPSIMGSRINLTAGQNFSSLFIPNKSILFSSQYSFAKKKQDKDEKKKKEKNKIKEEIGGDVTQIDLNKYEEPYKRIIQNYKVFLSKCRAGKLDASTFDDVQVRVGKEKFHINQLAQIAPKTTTSVIINPYDSDNIEAIEKSIKASDDTLEVLKVQKALSVSLPNSSIQELKKKTVEKVKKSLNDQKEHLKKERHACHEDLKKYEKIAQKDQLKTIQKEAKELFDKYNDMLQKMCKEKEKELLK